MNPMDTAKLFCFLFFSLFSHITLSGELFIEKNSLTEEQMQRVLQMMEQDQTDENKEHLLYLKNFTDKARLIATLSEIPSGAPLAPKNFFVRIIKEGSDWSHFHEKNNRSAISKEEQPFTHLEELIELAAYALYDDQSNNTVIDLVIKRGTTDEDVLSIDSELNGAIYKGQLLSKASAIDTLLTVLAQQEEEQLSQNTPYETKAPELRRSESLFEKKKGELAALTSPPHNDVGADKQAFLASQQNYPFLLSLSNTLKTLSPYSSYQLGNIFFNFRHSITDLSSFTAGSNFNLSSQIIFISTSERNRLFGEIGQRPPNLNPDSGTTYHDPYAGSEKKPEQWPLDQKAWCPPVATLTSHQSREVNDLGLLERLCCHTYSYTDLTIAGNDTQQSRDNFITCYDCQKRKTDSPYSRIPSTLPNLFRQSCMKQVPTERDLEAILDYGYSQNVYICQQCSEFRAVKAEEKRAAENQHIQQLAEDMVECDAAIIDTMKDPPGQRSIYIYPGDPYSEQYRLCTLARMPENSDNKDSYLLNPSMAAQAGFYYTGYKDRVKCFSCGVNVEKWHPSDVITSAYWHKEGCEHLRNTASSGNIPLGGFLNFRTHQNQSQPISTAPSTQQVAEHRAPLHPRSTGRALLNGRSPQHNPYANRTPHEIQTAQHITSQPQNMHKEAERVKTFGNAWICYYPSAKDLARAGFYYLTASHSFQCFSCNRVLVGLDVWNSQDDINSKHLQASPACLMAQGQSTANEMTSLQQQTQLLEPQDPSIEEQTQLHLRYPCENPKTSAKSSLQSRINSFISDHRWRGKVNKSQTPIRATIQQIAKAGFFYLGKSDQTQCYYCNGGLQNWNADDEPWAEHAKWYPKCPFLRQKKGIAFVEQIVQQHPTIIDSNPQTSNMPPSSGYCCRPVIKIHQADIDQEAIYLSSLPSNTNAANAHESVRRKKQLFIRYIAEQSAFFGDGIQADILADCLSKTRPNIYSHIAIIAENNGADCDHLLPFASELFNLLEHPNTPVCKSQAQRCAEHSALAAANEPMLMETAASVPSTSAQIPATAHQTESTTNQPSAGAPSITSNPEARLKELKDERTCKVCLENEIEIIFLPCGHLCTCKDCAMQLQQCPICRQEITSRMQPHISGLASPNSRATRTRG